MLQELTHSCWTGLSAAKGYLGMYVVIVSCDVHNSCPCHVVLCITAAKLVILGGCATSCAKLLSSLFNLLLCQ